MFYTIICCFASSYSLPSTVSSGLPDICTERQGRSQRLLQVAHLQGGTDKEKQHQMRHVPRSRKQLWGVETLIRDRKIRSVTESSQFRSMASPEVSHLGHPRGQEKGVSDYRPQDVIFWIKVPDLSETEEVNTDGKSSVDLPQTREVKAAEDATVVFCSEYLFQVFYW